MLVDVFPQIQEFVELKLPSRPLSNGLEIGNGDAAAGAPNGTHEPMDGIETVPQQSAPAIPA